MNDTRLRSPNESGEARVSRATVVKWFAAIVCVSFFLRIFYSSHLYTDDGLWFTVAEQMLRGKTLYREIYFDKPPVLALFYALIFSAFGAHIIVVRLSMLIYALAISIVLYLMGSRLYDRRIGLLAAAMFAVFSTSPVNNHVQGFNTDFMMLLPYCAAALVFTRACYERSLRFAFVGGVLTAVAVQTNPKGLFTLCFFALLLSVSGSRPLSVARERSSETDDTTNVHSAILFAMSLVGLAAGALPFVGYVLSTGSWSDYWTDVWRWGAAYAGYYPISRLVTRGVPLTAQYLLLNNTLLVGLIFVSAAVYRGLRSIRSRDGGAAIATSPPEIRSDATLLLWFAVSLAALAVGWRFYSNYFFQILPSLCLLGARGLNAIASGLKNKSLRFRRTILALLAIGFLFTLVRFHTRTAALAFDWLHGSKSGLNARWYHDALNQEERSVAAVVKGLPQGTEDQVGLEAMRTHKTGSTSPDYLFVWGSRDEIYYWSGLLPASKYLNTQPLTGVPADVHHDASSRPVLSAPDTACARIELARELDLARPRYIVDELGFYVAELSIQAYPELRDTMKRYEKVGTVGGFLIYRQKSEAAGDQ